MNNVKLFFYTLLNKITGKKNKHLVKKVQKYQTITTTQKHKRTQLKTYNKKVQIIRERIKQGKKVRVAFFVNMAQMFPAKPLYEKMQKDNIFEPFIVVVPDMRFGQEQQNKILKDTYDELSKEFENVILSCDKNTNIYQDFSDKTDIICYASPYRLSHEYYNIEHILNKNILPIHINYGFFRSKYDRLIIKEDSYSYFWKVFVENQYNFNEMKKYSPAKAKNAIITGYGKMDELSQYQQDIPNKRKRIIIAPHHSVEGGFNKTMELSNFFKYADLFLELPQKYPNIDFVFRPHPALFMAIAQEKFWGSDKTDEYITKMRSYKNVTYSCERNYLKEFAASDGIIQDCGSFLAEYFYTGKPHCYMLKNKEEIETVFTKLGALCLKHCYQAFDKGDIISFIDNVIIKGQDTKKEQRQKFAEENIKINYPNVCEKIIDHIKTELS